MSTTKTIPAKVARDRCTGSLIGLAVGNMLGIRFEGMPGREVRRVWPGGPLEAPLREISMPWDDDTAMAMELAQHLVESAGDLQSEPLYDLYLAWSESNGRGIGIMTSEVLRTPRHESKMTPAERVWRLRGGSAGPTASNGAVMRVAPIGVRFRRDPARILRNALADARLTHWEPLCGWSAAAVAVLVGDLIEERVTPLDEFLPAQGCPEGVMRGLLEEPPMDIETGGFDVDYIGYTLHAWKVALWASHVHGDFRECLQRVIRAGGDTDTNGAVAGAILGARFGLAGIPPAWREPLHEQERILQTGRRLHELGLSES
ncbi:MAG: ADP-ribosylglycohydrolase family protein [Acidobacteria bacterium]|nr:ADP-ribosylglycohydrolase family protein [Acidobacteriota bacterium]